MKLLLKAIFTFIGTVLTLVLIRAFMLWDFAIGDWTEASRTLIVIFSSFMAIFTIGVLATQPEEKNKENNEL